MSVSASLAFIGAVLAASVFGGLATLRRMGEKVPSCALMGVASAASLILAVLALLPSSRIAPGAMLPLMVSAAVLGVGWMTDSASTRLPHVTSNMALVAVSCAFAAGWMSVNCGWNVSGFVVVLLSVAPVIAGATCRPPTVAQVKYWYLLGVLAVVASSVLLAGFASGGDAAVCLSSGVNSVSDASGVNSVSGVGYVLTYDSGYAQDFGYAWAGPFTVAAVTLAVLAVGRILARLGRVGGGDPVWIAFCVMAASSHALLSTGVDTLNGWSDGTVKSATVSTGWLAAAVSVVGAATFLAVGGISALLFGMSGYVLHQRRSNQRLIWRSKPVSVDAQTSTSLVGYPLIAGPWTTVGLTAFTVIWKFTPLGVHGLLGDSWF